MMRCDQAQEQDKSKSNRPDAKYKLWKPKIKLMKSQGMKETIKSSMSCEAGIEINKC